MKKIVVEIGCRKEWEGDCIRQQIETIKNNMEMHPEKQLIQNKSNQRRTGHDGEIVHSLGFLEP